MIDRTVAEARLQPRPVQSWDPHIEQNATQFTFTRQAIREMLSRRISRDLVTGFLQTTFDSRPEGSVVIDNMNKPRQWTPLGCDRHLPDRCRPHGWQLLSATALAARADGSQIADRRAMALSFQDQLRNVCRSSSELGGNADPLGLLTVLYKKQFVLIEQRHCRVR